MSGWDERYEQAERLAPTRAWVVDRGALRQVFDDYYRGVETWDLTWDNRLAELDDVRLLYHLLQRVLLDVLFYREELERAVKALRAVEPLRAQLDRLPETPEPKAEQ